MHCPLNVRFNLWSLTVLNITCVPYNGHTITIGRTESKRHWYRQNTRTRVFYFSLINFFIHVSHKVFLYGVAVTEFH